MKTEMCLVICFLVGVLVFYLLKQSCGCSAVVEGQDQCQDQNLQENASCTTATNRNGVCKTCFADMRLCYHHVPRNCGSSSSSSSSSDNCEPNPCLNGGTCIPDSDGHRCQCSDGYSGNRCQTHDPCRGVDCGEHGTCIPDSDGHRCECSDGYSGDYCENSMGCCSR